MNSSLLLQGYYCEKVVMSYSSVYRTTENIYLSSTSFLSSRDFMSAPQALLKLN